MDKIKNIKIAFVFLLVITFMQLASAELSIATDTYVIRENQEVKTQIIIELRDTSPNLIFKSFKSVPVAIKYSTFPLPYDLSVESGGLYSGQIDWCNLTIREFNSEYEDEKIINTTQTTTSYYFTSGTNTGILYFDLRDLDNINAVMTCHFTDPNYLFVESVTGNTLSVFSPAYACKGCGDYTFEELSNANVLYETTTTQELAIYSIIDKIAELNFRMWLYIYWVFKIGIIFVGVYLIFYVMANIYYYLRDLERKI